MRNKLIIFALFSFLFFSCSSGDKENGTSDDKEVIKIGVIMPQTGPVSEPGKNALNGIRLAFDNYNKSAKVKVKLIVEDSKSNPKDGVTAINKLINSDNAKIIIGDIMSSVFLAAAPIAEQNQVIFFSPGASSPEVRNAGDYIFRNYLSDDFDGKVMANYIIKEKKINNIAIISVNNDYGIGVSKTFKQEVEKLGGRLIFNEQYEQGSKDFKTLLIKLKATNFDAIYMVCNPNESGYLVKQIKELGIKTDLFGNLSFENNEFINIAKGTFDEIVFSAPYFDLNVEKNSIKKFKKSYEKKYNITPDVASALGYDVAIILLEALQNSKYKVEDIKTSLYNIKNFDGITGRTSFDEKGDVLKDIQIKTISGNGSISNIKVFSINE